MKQNVSANHLHSEPGRSFCPVKCPVCRYDGDNFPALFNRAKLRQNDLLGGVNEHSNHIIFLLRGSLDICTAADEIYHLATGHCIFLGRESCPTVRATSPSSLVWLDFTNRMVLCHQDFLSRISVSAMAGDPEPIMKTDPMITEMIAHLPLINSPCFHLIKQYELFMLMRNRYADSELAIFFRSILRAAYDLNSFVMSCYRETQDIKEFARKANLSESTFTRRFNEVFGMTVHQWLMKQREKDLRLMILNGERDTKKLAEGIGLTNSSGLYQFCRKRFGCTVSEVIRRYGTESQRADGMDV